MSISVIIPLYNKVTTIGRAIKSVLQQDVAVEIIVVDDGSTDGSGSVVESFASHVRYIRQDNAGPSAARNLGAQASRFTILAFLDADDEFLPGCLAAHLACRCTRPDVKVTLSPSSMLHEKIIRRPRDFIPQGVFYYSNRFLHEIVTGMPVDAICVNRDVFEEINGFDPELRCWEITDFMYRLVLASPVVGFLDKNYVSVHRNPTNSQFARAKTNMMFQKRSLFKRLKYVGELPPDQRKILFQGISGAVKAFLVAGALNDAKEILQRTRASWHEYPEFGALYVLSCLPLRLIRAIVNVRRLLLSLINIALQNNVENHSFLDNDLMTNSHHEDSKDLSVD